MAAAVCAADPTYQACSRFVLRLSDAHANGSVVLRAGGAKRAGEGGRRSFLTTPRGGSTRDSQGDTTPRSGRDSAADGGLSRNNSISASFKRSGSSFLGTITS